MIKGVVFDLGNTLMHFAGDVSAVINHGARSLAELLASRGVPVDALSCAQCFLRHRARLAKQGRQERVEYRADQALAATREELKLPELDLALQQDAIAAYFAPEERDYVLYPGGADMLAQLTAAGAQVGLISNATDHALILRLLDRFALRPHFRVVMSSAGHGKRKPDPAIFHAMLDALGVAAADAVMVGDTLGEDILGAQLAGMRGGILVDVDPNPANALHAHVKPLTTVRTLAEVVPFLRSLDG